MKARRVVIVGGGAAGLSAAHTLRKRGIDLVLFGADGWVGGRMCGETIGGGHIDAGAALFYSSYDGTFRICKELGLDLKRLRMKLGWSCNGRWVMSYPVESIRTLLANWDFWRTFGFILPAAHLLGMKLVWGHTRQAQYLNFGSASRIREIDGAETLGDYVDRICLPDSARVAFRGFLETTMGLVGDTEINAG